MSFARAREISWPLITVCVALAVVTLGALVGGRAAEFAAVPMLALLLGMFAMRVAARWSLLVACLLLADLLIPNDGRYMLIGGAGFFQLEPYRVIIAVMVVGWSAALLVDPRVKLRLTGFEMPLAVIIVATLGSLIVNPARVNGALGAVIKSLLLFASFLVLLYLLVSVVRSRKTVGQMLVVAVCAGVVEAIGALIQRENGFNIFDHLHRFLPMFQFNLGAELTGLIRSGGLRALASAGHPIELSNTMAMLMPAAAYLAISRQQRLWWAAFFALLVGLLASGSKTGVIELVVMLLIFLWLRPRQTRRCWPALIVVVGLVSVLMPSAVNSVIDGFFPPGGFIHSQSTVGYYRGVQDNTRLSRIGPVLHSEFDKHSPFFGEGFGTRQTGRGVSNPAQILDDQWFDNLLETGIVGVLGWLWLFVYVVRKLGRQAKLERDTREGWLPVALAASIAGYAMSMATYDASGFIQATLLLFIFFGFASVVLRESASADEAVTIDQPRERALVHV